MEALYRDAGVTGGVVILTDPHGLVLYRPRRRTVSPTRRADVALRPGARWDEATIGTNAIGAAIAERQPESVIGGEHFFDVHSILSCSAAPIFDPFGAVAGVLDLTSSSNAPQALTLALVKRAAEQIERALFDAQFRNSRADALPQRSLRDRRTARRAARLRERPARRRQSQRRRSCSGSIGRRAARCVSTNCSRSTKARSMRNPASDDCVVQTSAGSGFTRASCGRGRASIGAASPAQLSPLRREPDAADAAADHRSRCSPGRSPAWSRCGASRRGR